MSVVAYPRWSVELRGERYGLPGAGPGAAAQPVRAVFRRQDLPPRLVISVGAGGVTTGGAGGPGGSSVFHTLVAPGGAGGGSGTGDPPDSGTPGEPGYVLVWEFD